MSNPNKIKLSRSQIGTLAQGLVVISAVWDSAALASPSPSMQDDFLDAAAEARWMLQALENGTDSVRSITVRLAP